MIRSWLSIIVTAIMLSGIVTKGFCGIQDSTGVTKINNQLHILYLVEPGETIYGLSTKYGISVADLMELNPALENGLKVGQIINIPYNPAAMAKTPAVDSNNIIHKVQSGETLYSLAKRYNTTVDQLMKWNNMDLKAGQEIVVGYKQQAPSENTVTTTTTTNTTTQNQNTTVNTTTNNTQNQNTTNTNTQVQNNATTTNQQLVVGVKDTVKQVVQGYQPYPFDVTKKQVLVIPFDPYLYFSDSDDEIAAKSNMPRTKVRQVFRRRLNALIDAKGYETIHLLGGDVKDSIGDLNKVYSSVTYSYQGEILNQGLINDSEKQKALEKNAKNTPQQWVEKQKGKITGTATDKYDMPNENEKYFSAVVKSPDFFTYYNTKYSVDYYVFITQFEVKTNYEHCLDRAALNYERTFITHYCIFDSTGKKIAGEKFTTHYNSNSNYVFQIVSDNMPKIVERIMAALPPPTQ